MSKLLDYLRLMRVSLLPTIWADVLMAFLLVGGSWQPLTTLAMFLICSSCFYLGGMVLNDLCDLEFDREHNPERVLPANKITRANAWILFVVLFTIAFVIVILLQLGLRSESRLPISVAIALAVFIWVYNFRGKRTLFGPLLMGGCRFLNILLVCSYYPRGTHEMFGFNYESLLVAAGIGVYVAGITFFARKEQSSGQQGELAIGAAIMAIGIGLLIWLPFTTWFDNLHANPVPARHKMLYCGLLAMMLFPVAHKVIVAVATGESADVKRAVITSLLTIIMIDASICYLACPASPSYALLVASLIIPAFLMSRRIMAT